MKNAPLSCLLVAFTALAAVFSARDTSAQTQVLYEANFNVGPWGEFTQPDPETRRSNTGWDYSIATEAYWGGYWGGVSEPPFNDGLFLAWAGTCSRSMSNAPGSRHMLTIAADIRHNAQPDYPPRVGLFNDSATNWANVGDGKGWSGYGPMILYHGQTNGTYHGEDGCLVFYRPTAAGGGSVTSSVIPGFTLNVRALMVIDTLHGTADGYVNSVAPGNKVIADFDLKGSWTIEQFRANITNYTHFGCDFGSFAGYVADPYVAQVPIPPSGTIISVK